MKESTISKTLGQPQACNHQQFIYQDHIPKLFFRQVLGRGKRFFVPYSKAYPKHTHKAYVQCNSDIISICVCVTFFDVNTIEITNTRAKVCKGGLSSFLIGSTKSLIKKISQAVASC